MTTASAPIAHPLSPATLAAGLRERLSSDTVVRENEPMARRTTLRVGGNADVWVEPASETDLAAVLAFASETDSPTLVIGRGSNLLVRDGGIRGVVISLRHPHFSRIEVQGDRIRCGAGARLKEVAMEARRHALAGFEFLEGIPGSVGGALRMNAGAHGGTTFEAVVEVRLLDREGNVHVLPRAGIDAVYRSCPSLKTRVAVEALFQGKADDQVGIEERMKEFNRRRWASQPAAPSAGCIFKNPTAASAGRIVDELGLKGTRVGGATVSQEHGNFIVTDGHATSADVLQLIDQVKTEVRRQRGIELETEVQVIGEEAVRP
jgi:UDP-N-acetylenolpyruvoylglucosamine reductase